MKKYLLKLGLAGSLMIMTIGAFAQAPGSSEATGGTAGSSALSAASGDVTSSASETLYIGPGNYQIDGTWEIYSKNVWISPDAVITGTGTIKFFNPSVAGGIASATFIDGNNNASFINVNIELQNAANMVLADIAGPGAPWTDVSANADLTIGKDFKFAVANGDALIGNYDMITATAATLSSYQQDRFVVTNGSGHLVHNNYAGAFIYPIGIVEGDYTPASVNNAAVNTVHAMVQSYATSTPPEINSNGIDRTWNIYADNAGGSAVVDLQHNLVSNDPNYTDAAGFVTQYGPVTPNATGQTTTSTTAWQSNNIGVGSGTGTLTTGAAIAGASERSLTYASLATSAIAAEASFTKSSSSNAPLPVTLISFTGQAVNCTAVLNWVTAAESGLLYYELQRSQNGADFKTVVQVAPKGNNSNYDFTDNDVLNGSLYYRLLIMEAGGKDHFSNIVSLNMDCNSRQDINIYPNPAQDRVFVTGLTSGNKVILINAAGQQLVTVIAGGNVQLVDISSFIAGTYMLQVMQDHVLLKSIKLVKK